MTVVPQVRVGRWNTEILVIKHVTALSHRIVEGGEQPTSTEGIQSSETLAYIAVLSLDTSTHYIEPVRSGNLIVSLVSQ